MSDDLMLDVEESLRQERLKKIWDEYGSSLITGMILAVLITAFIVGWRSWNQKVDRAQTVIVVEAIESDAAPDEILDIASDLRAGKKVLLQFHAAKLFLDDGKTAEALDVYDRIATHADTPDYFASYAAIVALRALQGSDDLNADNPYLATAYETAADQDSPWWPLASIEAAVFTAHHNYDYDGAIAYLDPVINAPEILQSVRQRAQALKHVYEVEASRTVIEEAAE